MARSLWPRFSSSSSLTAWAPCTDEVSLSSEKWFFTIFQISSSELTSNGRGSFPSNCKRPLSHQYEDNGDHRGRLQVVRAAHRDRSLRPEVQRDHGSERVGEVEHPRLHLLRGACTPPRPPSVCSTEGGEGWEPRRFRGARGTMNRVRAGGRMVAGVHGARMRVPPPAAASRRAHLRGRRRRCTPPLRVQNVFLCAGPSSAFSLGPIPVLLPPPHPAPLALGP